MTDQFSKTPLTEEQTKEIIDMAELFFPPEDIAINIGMPVEEFNLELLSQEGEVFMAFKTGWLKGEIPLRKSIAQASANGSNPAQIKMFELKRDSEMKLDL